LFDPAQPGWEVSQPGFSLFGKFEPLKSGGRSDHESSDHWSADSHVRELPTSGTRGQDCRHSELVIHVVVGDSGDWEKEGIRAQK
jgi:hypothetical protein